MATPNGQKVTIMLEELLSLGVKEAECDAHLIKIGGDQFLDLILVLQSIQTQNPALVDQSTSPAINIFESGHILFILQINCLLIPMPLCCEAMNWLFWLQGSAPYLGGGFGHFYSYAPENTNTQSSFHDGDKTPIDLLDKQRQPPYIAGSSYSIADIAIWAWYGNLALGRPRCD